MAVPMSMRAYGFLGLAAAVVAIRRPEPARPCGVRFPGNVAHHAATIGTGLSAPLGLLIAVGPLGRRVPVAASRPLAVLFTVGALCEPATWRSWRHPGVDRVKAVVATANVGLPLASLWSVR